MSGPINLRASAVVPICSGVAIVRGEDVTLSFRMVPPTNITGWTINMAMAPTYGSNTVLTLSASITDGPRGLFNVGLENANTSNLTVQSYVCDVRREDSSYKTTLAKVNLDLQQEVTT